MTEWVGEDCRVRSEVLSAYPWGYSRHCLRCRRSLTAVDDVDVDSGDVFVDNMTRLLAITC